MKMTRALCAAAILMVGCSAGQRGKTYHCSLTGKDFAKCCCTKKDGKLYCTEAKQLVDQCCCTTKDGKM